MSEPIRVWQRLMPQGQHLYVEVGGMAVTLVAMPIPDMREAVHFDHLADMAYVRVPDETAQEVVRRFMAYAAGEGGAS